LFNQYRTIKPPNAMIITPATDAEIIIKLSETAL
jgi:N12 class adenine-specific DNA methylase